MLVYLMQADYISSYKSCMKEKKIIIRLQGQYIIKKYRVKLSSFTIREDGLLDVRGSVQITGNNIYKLPLKFGNVTDDFCCKGNSLSTLKGAPKYVGGNFNCSDNNLKSLRHGPGYVGESYFCHENNLTILKGCPLEIIGRFNCSVNDLESLIYGPKRVGKSYYAHHNKLKTLVGSPLFVGGSFNVAANFLSNFAGCPDYIGETFSIDYWLTSLFMEEKSCYVRKVRIESLERMDSCNSILPELILSRQKCLPVLFKYNKYLLEIWDEKGLTSWDDLNNILSEIEGGLL